MPSKKMFSKKDMAIGVSFLPPERPAESGVTTYQKGVIVIAVALTIGVFGAAWMYFFVQVRSVKKQTAVLEARAERAMEWQNQKKNEVEAVQKISRVIMPAKTLLLTHPKWTKFFTFIEEATLPDVKFGTFAGDAKGITMTGNAKDYETIARQMISLRMSPLVRDLRVSGLGARVGPQGQMSGVDFTLAFALDESFLKP